MDNKVLVRERVFQEDKLYDGVVVLRYKIKYPYSSGIQTFTIPYSIDGVEEATCY